jgi:hypothetical protein
MVHSWNLKGGLYVYHCTWYKFWLIHMIWWSHDTRQCLAMMVIKIYLCTWIWLVIKCDKWGYLWLKCWYGIWGRHSPGFLFELVIGLNYYMPYERWNLVDVAYVVHDFLFVLSGGDGHALNMMGCGHLLHSPTSVTFLPWGFLSFISFLCCYWESLSSGCWETLLLGGFFNCFWLLALV